MKEIYTLIVMVSLASVAFAQQAEGPRELKVLTSQYERAVEKALEPITAKYLAALKRLKAKLAKEQKLEQALAVDAVIKELGGKASIHMEKEASLENILKSKRWVYRAGKNISKITFSDNGKARMTGFTNANIQWSVTKNRYLTIVYKDGNSCKFDYRDLSQISVVGLANDKAKSKRYLSPEN